MQQVFPGVFAFDRKEPVIIAPFEREKMHAVVMHARLQGLLARVVRGVRLERGRTRWVADRITPSPQHARGVAARHPHLVGAGRRDALKAEQLRGGYGAQGA